MDFKSDLGQDCWEKSNFLFLLLLNIYAVFAHRAAVDNKRPSVFMLSLSCKNLSPIPSICKN